jgi:lantibiotic leader peptide-processing serine protease
MWRLLTSARVLLRVGRCFAVGGLLLGALPATAVSASAIGQEQTYLVVYKDAASTREAGILMRGAGGSVVSNYQQIGVVVARSNRTDFGSKVLADYRVDSAAPTRNGGVQLKNGEPDSGGSGSTTTVTPAPGDSLSSLQWDMRQIHAFEAQSITSGSRSVLVGDIDTGADYTHPDLSPNLDFSNSVSCIGGVANTSPAAWKDDNGHGTHTGGTIAAARNGFGIVGVAPNVRLAAIKAGDAQGFFFPEAVVCAFMWAGTHGVNVTNNSYFADPYYFNCQNDPVQRAIWKAETRAIKFAERKGVTVVAAMGNFSDDLAHPTQDRQSPDNTTAITRPLNNSCEVSPVEAPGVIGVTADGNLRLKSFYSSYGLGLTLVTAPGGDSRLQLTADAPNGRVLSTWPSYIGCSRKVMEGTTTYCYAQGTSMASPHVAGVAALIESIGITDPREVKERIKQTAVDLPCPTAAQMLLYAPYPSANNDAPQVCQGGPTWNGFYGGGEVNALAALGG